MAIKIILNNESRSVVQEKLKIDPINSIISKIRLKFGLYF